MEQLNHHHDIEQLLKPSKWSIFWGVVMWVGLISTFVWATLKALGYIHSPPWQESMPFFMLGLTLMGGSFKFGQEMGDIQRTLVFIQKDIASLNHRFSINEKEITQQRIELTKLRTEFSAHLSYHHQR